MPVKNTCTTAFPSPNPTTCATIDITGYSQGTTVEYIVGNAIADNKPTISSADGAPSNTAGERSVAYSVSPALPGGLSISTVASICVCNGVAQIKDDGSMIGHYCADHENEGYAVVGAGWCYADDGLCADQKWSSSSSMFWVKAVCNQGVISGTPTVGAAEAAYVVTATNSAGDVGKKTITITVKSPLGKKPVITSYTVAAATGCVSAPKSGWVRPNGEPHSAMCRDGSAGCVAISAAGAESCRDQCKAGGYKYVEREAICDTASYHITSGIHPLYTVIAVYAPTYTRYTCIYTIYTPKTPLNTPYTPYIRLKTTY